LNAWPVRASRSPPSRRTRSFQVLPHTLGLGPEVWRVLAKGEAVIEDGDQAALMLALRQVAQAQGGIAEIARNPELRSLNAVLRATGLRIAVRPIGKRAA